MVSDWQCRSMRTECGKGSPSPVSLRTRLDHKGQKVSEIEL